MKALLCQFSWEHFNRLKEGERCSGQKNDLNMTQHEKMIPIPVVHASLPVWDTGYDLTKLIRYILIYWKRSKEDDWRGVLYSIFALVCRPVSCFLVPSTGDDNSYCRWSPAYASHVLTNIQVKQPVLTDMNLYADFFLHHCLVSWLLKLSESVHFLLMLMSKIKIRYKWS